MWFVATFNTFQPDATKLVPIVVRTNLPYALLRSAPREVRVTTYRCRTTINSLPDLVYVRRDHLHVASTSPYLHVHAIALCPQPLPSPATHAPQLRVQTSCLTPHHTTPHLTAPHCTSPSHLHPFVPCHLPRDTSDLDSIRQGVPLLPRAWHCTSIFSLVGRPRPFHPSLASFILVPSIFQSVHTTAQALLR